MKVVFLSNFYNHHQSSLSDALWKETGGEYLFVESEPMPWERKLLGWEALAREYVLPLKGNETMVLEKLREADLVIAGSAPEWLVRRRIRTGKLLFRYAERPLKNGKEPWKFLPRLLRWHWRNPPGKPIYLLCASAYTAGDYAKFGLFRGRTFRWGYFPERKEYDPPALLAGKNPREILWCGRFLELKHPEDGVLAAKRLREEGYAFRLSFIGTGDREAQLRELVRELGMEAHIRFLGTLPPEQVRQAMEKAGIFLFTSDRREGWGAVLNEAMNSGCAVVASHAIGGVPFLITDGENALVYPSGDVQAITEKLRFLLDHPEIQKKLGEAAYETIQDLWNPELAARRLLELARRINEGETGQLLYSDGPCSPAQIIDEGWFV